MEPLLTAEELEALKQAQEPLEGPQREVRSVDLVACDHRAFALLPELQQTADRIARNLEKLLTRELRAQTVAEQRPVEIVPGGRLRELWGDPRFVYGVDLDGQEDAAAVAIDGFVGGAFVSRQFGGDIELPALDRAPTGTERRTVARLAGQVMTALVEGLTPLAEVSARLCPDRVRQPSSAAVVLFAVEVQIGEHKGRVSLAMDTTCGCFEGRARGPEAAAMPVVAGELTPALGHVGVEVKANLGQRAITMREFFALAPGDVLTLDTPVDTEIEVLVAGKRKFVGVPLLQHGLLSVQINGTLQE